MAQIPFGPVLEAKPVRARPPCGEAKGAQFRAARVLAVVDNRPGRKWGLALSSSLIRLILLLGRRQTAARKPLPSWDTKDDFGRRQHSNCIAHVNQTAWAGAQPCPFSQNLDALCESVS